LDGRRDARDLERVVATIAGLGMALHLVVGAVRLALSFVA
jgi:hypothetical protein